MPATNQPLSAERRLGRVYMVGGYRISIRSTPPPPSFLTPDVHNIFPHLTILHGCHRGFGAHLKDHNANHIHISSNTRVKGIRGRLPINCAIGELLNLTARNIDESEWTLK